VKNKPFTVISIQPGQGIFTGNGILSGLIWSLTRERSCGVVKDKKPGWQRRGCYLGKIIAVRYSA
jgi:hypothetical protein